VHLDLATAMISLVLLALLAAASFVDYRQMIIPDWVNAALLLLGCANAFSRGTPTPQQALVGAVVGSLAFLLVKWSYRQLRGKDGLGWGDIKFMAGAGSLTGPLLLPWLVLFASLSGLGYVLLNKPLKQNSRLPFAPHLAIGLLACWGLMLTNVFAP
jgi:prepilin signal peptidase PulO-like enzyme (type II secretory pathway)